MRKGLVVLLAAVLVAAFALPGMAETDFSGYVRSKGWVSNWANGGAGTTTPSSDDPPTNSFVETRSRVLMKSGTENAKFVFQAEFDMNWGDSAYTTGRNTGGGLESDTTNIETKNLYLWFKIPDTSWDFQVGIQNQSDSYAGTFFGVADMAGVFAKFKFEPVDFRLGWSKWWENSVGAADDIDLFVAEAKFSPVKEVKLGINLYFLNDRGEGSKGSTSGVGTATGVACLDAVGNVLDVVGSSSQCPVGTVTTESVSLNVGALYGRGAAGTVIPAELAGYDTLRIYMPGIDAAFKLGPVNLSAWFFYQFGTAEYLSGSDSDIAGFAGDIRADMNLGPGKFFIEGLYVSGDDTKTDSDYDSIITASNYNLAGSFYARTDFQILLPNYDDLNCSPALSYDVANGGAGLMHVGAGYSQKFTDKISGKLGVGYLAATEKRARDQGGAANFASKKDMAWEVNANVNYNIMKGLDFGVTGAYAFLGGAYDATSPGAKDPDDPYMLYANLKFGF